MKTMMMKPRCYHGCGGGEWQAAATAVAVATRGCFGNIISRRRCCILRLIVVISLLPHPPLVVVLSSLSPHSGLSVDCCYDLQTRLMLPPMASSSSLPLASSLSATAAEDNSVEADKGVKSLLLSSSCSRCHCHLLY
jgi:hypothetical protein